MSVDMNLRSRSAKPRERQALLVRAYELGWDTIVWNIQVNEKVSTEKPTETVPLDVRQSRLANQQRVLVAPVAAHSHPAAAPDTSDTSSNVESKKNVAQALIRQLSRVTVVLDDALDVHSLGAGNDLLRAFHIVAVRPTNARAFSAVCQNADVDVISLDISRRLPFPLNRKLVEEAVKRGLHFELCYDSLLDSSTARREALNGGRALVQCLRGRNLVLSSGADSVAGLRGPQDALCLAQALGLDGTAARNALRSGPLAALKHGEQRQQRYLPMLMLSKADFDKRDALQKHDEAGAGAGAGGKRKRADTEGRRDADAIDDSCSDACSTEDSDNFSQDSAAAMLQRRDDDYLGFR